MFVYLHEYIILHHSFLYLIYTHKHSGKFLGIYAGLGTAQAFFILLASIALAVASILASKKIHNIMLGNILRSPMVFFDTTPLGRILNRFSRDIYMIDEAIPRSVRGFIVTLFSVVSTIIVILIATPIFATVILPLGIFYALIQVMQNGLVRSCAINAWDIIL